MHGRTGVTVLISEPSGWANSPGVAETGPTLVGSVDAMSSHRSATDIRADLGHPIIDADGHVFEHYPALNQYCLDEGLDGGLYPQMGKCSFSGEPNWASLPPDERLARRSFRGPVVGAASCQYPRFRHRCVAGAVPRPHRGAGNGLRGVLPQHRAQLPCLRRPTMSATSCAGPSTATWPTVTRAWRTAWPRWPPSPLTPPKRPSSSSTLR